MYFCLLSFASIPNYQWLQSKDTGRNSSWIFFFFWAKVHDFLSPAIYLSLMFLLLCFFFFAEKFFYSALDSIFENWNKVLSLPFETSCSTSKWYITTVLAFCFWLFRIFIETKTHLYNNSQDQATLYNKSFMLKQNREDI